MSQDQLNALIGDIYEAALDEQAMPAVIAKVAAGVGGVSAILTFRGPGGAGAFATHRLDPTAMAIYNTHFFASDPWVDLARRWPVGTAVQAERDLSADSFQHTDFYNDFIRRYCEIKLVRCVGGLMTVGDLTIGLGVHREKRHDAFDDDALARTELLMPHLRRMLAIRTRLGLTQDPALGAGELWEAMGVAALRVDRDGRLLQANSAADQLLSHADGLSKPPGQSLRAALPNEATALSAVIRRASEGVAGGCRISRPSGAPALSLVATPAPRTGRRTGEAIVFISDPARRPFSLGARLREIYGLSFAEAEVCLALAAGDDLPTISETREVSISTLRTQLRSILSKTQTTRQAGVVALVAQLTPLT